ncbi:Rrf2 family transcriptional regulator [Paenibacillus sp. SC116]|uniref:Rrf2 family transcriptional regulator n=1 Tax=Paenibacillus sp. SC116 TaxID=2968986 RepID=UPI00215AEB3C|nr:Rrf2 family transcriptional regulator [Paenibacillus sp. SC116]MCR8842459.1 Rrf2 family transcriptional regulator [Paenibacillus sp. SC116]
MAYSIGVEYGLHCLVYLIGIPSNSTIGIKELAEFQGISETYLSKIFGKLSKSGIVHSVPGVKGGYRLAKSPNVISFWDVVEAIEGNKPIFQCKNILSKGFLDRDSDKPSCQSHNPSCTINLVMLEAEEKMRNELRAKTLDWLDKELDRTLPPKRRENTKAFFDKKE